MRVGSLVQYVAREGELPIPAIIMRVWPNDRFELHAFHFEQPALHIRDAHPSQITVVVDPDVIEEIMMDFASLGGRVSDLEGELEDLRQEIRKMRHEPSRNPAPAPAPAQASATEQEPIQPEQTGTEQIDASMIDLDEPPQEDNMSAFEEPEPGPEPVESTQQPETQTRKGRGRAAWPH